jgi:hypothetical protein
MPPGIRSFAAIIAGMLAAVALVMAMDWIVSLMHPLPSGFDYRVVAQMNAHIEAAPMHAKFAMVGGWVLAPFVGGVVATRIADRMRPMYAWAITGLFFATTIGNLVRFAHPQWMWAVALVGVPAAGWYAARLSPKD